MRLAYLQANGRKGVINELAGRWDVTRKTIGLIVNEKTRELQGVTNGVDEKKAELRSLEYKVDTYKERANLIRMIKTLDIVPIMKKIQHNAGEDQRKRMAQMEGSDYSPSYKDLTDNDSSKLKSAVGAIEQLLRGLDDMHKVDIHFHMDKIITVIQNIDDDTGRLLVPELKKMLCTSCPLFIKHHKEVDKS